MVNLILLLDMRVLINYDCRMWQGYMDSTCFTMLNTKYLCFAPGWAVYGVWCEMYQVTVSEWTLSGLCSRLWLVNVPIFLLWLADMPHVLCSVWPCYCDPAWLQWHQLTPDTNCFHLSLQSYQESLTTDTWDRRARVKKSCEREG